MMAGSSRQHLSGSVLKHYKQGSPFICLSRVSDEILRCILVKLSKSSGEDFECKKIRREKEKILSLYVQFVREREREGLCYSPFLVGT